MYYVLLKSLQYHKSEQNRPIQDISSISLYDKLHSIITKRSKTKEISQMFFFDDPEPKKLFSIFPMFLFTF